MKNTYSQPPNSQAETQPTQSPHTIDQRVSWAEPPRPPKSRCGCCFLYAIAAMALLGLTLWIYLAAPGRTNILLMGLDSREPGSNLGRTDTLILTTFIPSEQYLGMLSIPRDLWVAIPGNDYNRINTAHFFAEANLPGSGSAAAVETVQANFGVDVHHYARVRFDNFLDLVDALGGVDVELPRPMFGYPEGTHHMDGLEALAFVRDRQGSDDFSRMEHGQIFLASLAKKVFSLNGLMALPQTTQILLHMIDTDIPVWKWPMLGFTLLRTIPNGIDNRVISRDMVIPFTSAGGAQVLAPNWEEINPVLLEMFDQ